jgi:hypothetical protein
MARTPLGQLLPWDAYQPRNTISSSHHDFFQYTGSNCSYLDMNGCPQMPVSSNVNAYNGWFDQAMWGTDESSCDIVATVEYHHQPSPSPAGHYRQSCVLRHGHQRRRLLRRVAH